MPFNELCTYINRAEMEEVLKKMELKWMRDPKNPVNISIVVEHVAEMEGILLRYLPGDQGFKGKFVDYNVCQLKPLEDNKCITHRDSDYKPHKLKFTFAVDEAAVEAAPGFEVIAVETYTRWVINKNFVEVDSLGGDSSEEHSSEEGDSSEEDSSGER